MKFLATTLFSFCLLSISAHTYFPYHEKKDPTPIIKCLELQSKIRNTENTFEKINTILYYLTPTITLGTVFFLYKKNHALLKQIDHNIIPHFTGVFQDGSIFINNLCKNILIKKYQNQIDTINLKKSTDIEVR